MNFTLDIILLGVFLLFIAVGVRRGFIKSAARFVGSLIAAFLSSALGEVVAQWAFDTLFRAALVEKISETIVSLGGGDAATALDEVLGNLPDFIVRALSAAGVSAGSIEGAIASQSGRAAELIADSLAPVFVGFLKVLAVLVLFLLFMVAVRLLADLLAGVFHLPILRQLDGILGGLFGLLFALVSVWIVISAVQVFTPMLATEAQLNIQAALRNSVIAGTVIRGNPLGVIFK